MRPEQLTAGQEAALAAILRLRKEGEPGEFIIINGYAGTGKTTLLGVAVEELRKEDVANGRIWTDVLIVAPTGKAALRVKEATGLPASTIHQWLYEPKQNQLSGLVEFTRKEVGKVSRPASGIVIVEEASMVSPEVWDDLQPTCVALDLRIVVVGDEFQLPPVYRREEGKPLFNLLTHRGARERVNLTEVTRQALESPIIRASMDLRFGNTTEALMNHDLPIATEFLDEAMRVIQAEGAVICHRNATRHRMNGEVRAALKRPADEIQVDEPLLVLKNNYTTGVYNGEVIFFKGWSRTGKLRPEKHAIYDFYTHRETQSRMGKARVVSWYRPYQGDEEDDFPEVILGMEQIQGLTDHMGLSTAFDKTARALYGSTVPYLHCNWGYTLTCHKSQGSEWPEVMVVIESSVDIHGHEGRRWLYTALTRAKQAVMLYYL